MRFPTRSLRASSGDEDDDFGAIPRESELQAAGVSDDPSDDYILMTNPPQDKTLPPDTPAPQHPHHHHHKPPNPLLEAGTIILWIVVGIAAIYYFLSEQKRRQRRRRRQRQERLEVFSPKKQSNRRVELVKVLKGTTMTVSQEDLVYHLGENNNENDPSKATSDDDTNEGKTNLAKSKQQEEENLEYDLEQGLINVEEETDTNPSTVSLSEDDKGDQNCEIEHLCCEAIAEISSSSWEEEEQEKWTLRIPIANKDSSRPMEVPASCVICLKHFRVQDQVTWSPNNHLPSDSRCPHAFHQQCIIEWLAKLPDCSCPICRNPFCQLPSAKGKR